MPLSTTRVVNDAGHVTDHNDIVTALNTKISTTDANAAYVSRTGNVGFFGTVPVAKATALTAPNTTAFTAADAAAVDATYGAEEAGVINNLRTRLAEMEAVVNNLRTRLNEVEARVLRGYGLLP